MNEILIGQAVEIPAPLPKKVRNLLAVDGFYVATDKTGAALSLENARRGTRRH